MDHLGAEGLSAELSEPHARGDGPQVDLTEEGGLGVSPTHVGMDRRIRLNPDGQGE